MAAGVGKTYRALQELHDLGNEGVDALIALLETHGRADVAALAEGLELLPRQSVDYRGVTLTEMDTNAVLRRHPTVALVDELAHTNAPGSEREKRYQDVAILLRAGIDIISTMNVQHIESLNDLVERLTGVHVRERVPDHILLEADELVLVDITPEVLRQRLEAGKIYRPDQIDRALTNFFKTENLVILRELALRQVADAVEGPIGDARGVKQRVAVAITATPNAATLIRRGARLAQRLKADLHVIHVHDRPLTRDQERLLDAHRLMTQALDGTYTTLTGHDASAALIDYVSRHAVTQIVLGASLRSRWQELSRGSLIRRILRNTKGVDIYIIGRHDDASRS